MVTERGSDVGSRYHHDPGHAHDTHAKHVDTDIIENDGVRYTLATIQAICIILATVLNAFIIFFILKYKKMRRNATAYLILNLAICDFIGSSLQQPMRLVDILLPFANPDSKMNTWGATFCKITGFNSTLISCSGFLTVVGIAIERYLLICYPLRAKAWLTHRNVKITILCIWIISVVTTLPLPIRFTNVVEAHFEEVNVTICTQDLLSQRSRAGSEYYMFIFILYFVVPVLVISTVYTRVFYVLYSRISGVEVQNPVSRKVMLARKRLAKMMLFIATIFTALHGPYFITYFMIACGLGIPHNAIFCLIVLETLPLVNAVINPFIYSAHSRTLFRRKMVNFLGGQYEDSSIYRKNSTSDSRRKQSSRMGKDEVLLGSYRKSNATDTTSVRTADSFKGENDLGRGESFRTQESRSIRSDSFRSAEFDSVSRDDYMNNTKDSSFEEKIPLSLIAEESEI